MNGGPSLLHPRDEILLTMERIYRYRMTTTSGGNLSIRDGRDIWITPARVDKGNLRRDDMVCVHADDRVEGPHRPSSEFPFHRAIYQARTDIGGIVHAHPVALVAFSICRRTPQTRVFHQAHHVCGEVGFASYALPGSGQLAENIARTFAEGFDCVVLENHGVVVGGRTLQQAFQRLETLEFTAKTIIRAAGLGEVRLLTDDQLRLSRTAMAALPALQPAVATSREKELRQQLCQFVHRGCRQRLLISTEGSFSARLDDEAFLITPYEADRYAVDLDDLVLVREGRAEAGKTASRAARDHLAIYRRHPGIAAIVNAYPVNATAFSVTGATLAARTIPESYLFLRDVSNIPYGVQFENSAQLAETISPDQPVALLENDGVMVAGTSVLDAFDRLEVLESTAAALIDSRGLGPLACMPDQAIEELKQAFFGKAPSAPKAQEKDV
jgi:L-fuculose-phosphate aldolase